MKAFIEYSNNMDDIDKNIEEYNPNRKRKYDDNRKKKKIEKENVMKICYDMIAGMLSNKKICPIVTELFIREKKLNIYLVFITQSYFAVPKHITLNSTH